LATSFHFRHWHFPAAAIDNSGGSVRKKSGHRNFIRARRVMTDAVEKGKNRPIEIFAFAPVETGFS
jgi:hypothetical protein